MIQAVPPCTGPNAYKVWVWVGPTPGAPHSVQALHVFGRDTAMKTIIETPEDPH